jgi:thiol-disulfide isomerase/thioredoxin
MLPLLEKHPTPLSAVGLPPAPALKSGIDTYLKTFAGNTSPLAIELPDTRGDIVSIEDFTGKVTLINFWATWCPPCVGEIPSLNRLKNKMQGQPFQLISINYAEDRQAINKFMQEVKVEFPVLLDQDGSFATRWNIITYPSTFVIDKEGKIRYGVNAAIEWDSPELLEKIELLTKQ